MSVIRAFIAIDLPVDLQKRLDQVSASLKQSIDRSAIRWVTSGNMHLTLKFLGDVSVTSLNLVKETIRAVALEHHCFDFSVGGLGAFPTSKRPRVIWVGIEAPPELGNVQSALESRLSRLGYPLEERPFSAHLTLGRVARTADPQDIQKIAQSIQATRIGFLGAVQVQQLHLYQSDLNPSGAVYTRLFSATLLEKR
jgi:2'-5' RNA ligase